MKKIVSLLLAIVCFIPSFGQIDLGPRNIVKTNLIGLGLFTINANYEYKLNEKFSVGMVGGYKIPTSYTLEAAASSTSSNGDMAYTGEIQPQGYFVNPYARLYTNGAMTGFYTELFLRYYNYDFQIPYDYQKNGGTINANAEANASAVGAGIMVGTQISLGKIFVLDFYAGAGLATGNAHAETNDPNLDAQDFADIKAEMDKIETVELIFVGKIIDNMTYGANETSAWADIKGYTMPILRGGISFGVMF